MRVQSSSISINYSVRQVKFKEELKMKQLFLLTVNLVKVKSENQQR